MVSAIISSHWSGEADLPQTSYDVCYTLRDTRGNVALPERDVVASAPSSWQGIVRKVSGQSLDIRLHVSTRYHSELAPFRMEYSRYFDVF